MTQTFTLAGDAWQTANWQVAQRMAAPFAPHPQSPANMTVVVDPGALLKSGVLVETGTQSTATLTRPSSVRVDRIVIDRGTGLISVVSGTDGSMAPPALPANSFPCARVFLTSTMPAITADAIFDERVLADAAATAATPVACRAVRTTDQTGIVNGSLQKVLFNDAPINVGGGFDTTNNWFKPTVAGYYSVFLQCAFTLSAGNVQLNAAIYKTGSTVSRAEYGPGANSMQAVAVSDLIYLNGTSDYLEFYTAQASGGTLSLMGGSTYTYMTAAKVA